MTVRQPASPTLCRLQLGNELRQIRLRKGLTSTQVVKKLIWSPSKLTRLETGENATVEPADVMALCQIYEVDEETAKQLEQYAAVTKTKRDWWQSPEYRPVIGPGPKAIHGLESSAASLHAYNSEWVPGLFQTPEYIRTLHRHSHGHSSEEDIECMVELRQKRQKVLRQEVPLKFAVVVNEAVLLRQVGGRVVMKAQLARMIEEASAPNIDLQVVPFKAGHYRAMNGPFTIIRFREESAVKPIVYLENLADHWVLRRSPDVEMYEEAFNELRALAPGPQESLNLITKAMKEL
ncbi:helix-turn-helix domain-containing protein [Streptomyces sp. NPDC059142]|uniref:helix-turn-helix domain-containing protein n=1 Tax=unclassified Streptomyces TaxID=2593676 RepID=UPI0036CC9D7F